MYFRVIYNYNSTILFFSSPGNMYQVCAKKEKCFMSLPSYPPEDDSNAASGEGAVHYVKSYITCHKHLQSVNRRPTADA